MKKYFLLGLLLCSESVVAMNQTQKQIATTYLTQQQNQQNQNTSINTDAEYTNMRQELKYYKQEYQEHQHEVNAKFSKFIKGALFLALIGTFVVGMVIGQWTTQCPK